MVKVAMDLNLDLGFEQILIKDFLLMSVIAMAAGIGITRWLLVPAGGLLCGTLIASFAPSAYTLPLLIVTVAGAALTAAYLLHRLGLPGGAAED